MMHVEDLYLGYENRMILEGISFDLTPGAVTTIIGPNGSGKSTLLKAMARCLKPKMGLIQYQDKSLTQISTKELAKSIALLPQAPQIPHDYTVFDLVCQGRFPYSNWMGRLGAEDYDVVNWAIEATQLGNLVHREVATLSGGERQRAFIAMSLAQEPDLLFLDEPTTHLDIAHQFEVLELVSRLNREMNISIVMVLHDLSQAMKYSDEVLVVHEGQIYAHGKSEEVMQEQLCADVFGIRVRFVIDEISGERLIIPLGTNGAMPWAV